MDVVRLEQDQGKSWCVGDLPSQGEGQWEGTPAPPGAAGAGPDPRAGAELRERPGGRTCPLTEGHKEQPGRARKHCIFVY